MSDDLVYGADPPFEPDPEAAHLVETARLLHDYTGRLLEVVELAPGHLVNVGLAGGLETLKEHVAWLVDWANEATRTDWPDHE